MNAEVVEAKEEKNKCEGGGGGGGGGPTWGEMEIDERLFAGNEIS